MSWERAEEIRKDNVSQTGKQAVIEKLVTDWWEDDTGESGLAGKAYDAGYRAAKEDAAKLVEGKAGWANLGAGSLAFEIRKLEPKP